MEQEYIVAITVHSPSGNSVAVIDFHSNLKRLAKSEIRYEDPDQVVHSFIKDGWIVDHITLGLFVTLIRGATNER